MRFPEKSLHCLALLIIVPLLCICCSLRHKSPPEFRGVWLHPGLFSLNQTRAVEQMDSLFSFYRDIGINNLFCYNTTTDENNFQWDYLDALIKKGHEKGIRIHPIFYPVHELNLEKEMVKNPDWLIRDMDGKYQPHYNLANPQVRKYWVGKISAALKYDIDGIHLDYIRFPLTQMYSYDSATCEAFKREFHYSPVEVSHDCGSIIWCEWIKWNEKQVTQLVAEIRQVIKESGKQVILGADVFPDLETSKVLIAQDWGSWTADGLVDFICPLLYTNNLDLFKEYLGRAKSLTGNKCKVYPGIGVYTSNNKITKELIVKEVNIARELGAVGMVFFSGNSFNKEMRDTLKADLFSNVYGRKR
ncbi:MAG: family 10 glycosylhydrolase [Bacteroidales bacterium]